MILLPYFNVVNEFMIAIQDKKLMMMDFQKEIDGYLLQWFQGIEYKLHDDDKVSENLNF